MGIVRDITVEELKQAVNNIDTSTLAQDSTLQDVVTAINNISGGSDPVTNTTVNSLCKDTTGQSIASAISGLMQSIASAISGLGQTLGSDKANISGDNIANPSAFRGNLGFKSTLLFGTTGNTLYSNFYYGDIDLTFSSSKIYSLIITTTTSNRPVFVQILGDTKLRIWSTVASTDASVMIFYYD